MKRILAYMRNYPPPFDGGGFYYSYYLINELSKNKFEITVFSHEQVASSENTNIRVIQNTFVKLGRYEYKNMFAKLFDIIRCIIALRQEINQQKYDLILSDAGYIQNLIVFLATFDKKLPRVSLVLGEEISIIQKLGGVKSFIQKFLLNKYNLTIVISNFTNNLLRNSRILTKSILVYPSLSLDNLLPDVRITKVSSRQKLNISQEDFVLLFIGRHIERKGLINLVRAIELIEDDHIKLLVAGNGSLTAKLKKLVAEKHLNNRVTFLGFIENSMKPYLYCAADVFITPNIEVNGDTEGFGIVFLEAAFFGLPIIFGQEGGAVEAVKNGYNGIQVNGQNTHEIVDAINTYRHQEELFQTHSKNGKEWVRQFSWDNQVRSLINILSRIS